MAVFRVEKNKDYTIMSNHHLRNTNLSLKGKGMMSLILSLPDNWNYTTKGLASICKDGVDSISATLRELEQHGYLTRERQRDEQGRMGETVYTIHEQPIDTETPENKDSSPKRDFPVQVNPILEKHAQLSTKKLNSYELTTQSINPADVMDEMENYRKIMLENIEYDYLLQQHSRERLDEVVELLLEVVCSKRSSVRVAGNDFPLEAVKSRFLKLDSSHIEYAFECIDKNTTQIRNIKSYLLTTLYNAPATMDSYYRMAVNHGLYGKQKGGD